MFGGKASPLPPPVDRTLAPMSPDPFLLEGGVWERDYGMPGLLPPYSECVHILVENRATYTVRPNQWFSIGFSSLEMLEMSCNQVCTKLMCMCFLFFFVNLQLVAISLASRVV